MRLTYRGACYTVRNHSIETTDTALSGRFLGVRYQIRTARKAQPQKINQSLSYRMVKYSV